MTSTSRSGDACCDPTAAATTAVASDDSTPIHSNCHPPLSPLDEDPPPSGNITKNHHSSSRPSLTRSQQFVLTPLKLLLALLLGSLLGAIIISHLLTTEYSRMLSLQKSRHLSSISRIQAEFRNYVSNATEEKSVQMNFLEENLARSLEEVKELWKEEVDSLKKEGERKEIMYYQTVESALGRNVHTLTLAQEGLEMAYDRYKQVQSNLSEATQKLEIIQNEYRDMQVQQENLENQRIESEKKLKQLRRELEATGEELERRDMERAECDGLHRNLIQCQKSLETTKDNADEHERGKGSDRDDEDDKETCRKSLEQEREDLLLALEQNEKLAEEIRVLRLNDCDHRRGDDLSNQMEEKIAGLEKQVEESQFEMEYWRDKNEMMTKKIKFRSKKEVLERYGPGPHHVEFAIRFPTTQTTEAITLRLSPHLDAMPHTIHTFLTLVERQQYNRGTFVSLRPHVLVAGPVDMHDVDNNRQLEHKMTREGYFPDGALLFNEYSGEFPHVAGTVGFNEEMGGPVFYVNLVDNTDGHGPSDGNGGGGGGGGREGDPCFGEVVEGFDVIEKIKSFATAEGMFEGTVYIVGSRVLKAND
ncbi:hypothetical protein ACHAXS_014031 [Conticribra weissflogii]